MLYLQTLGVSSIHIGPHYLLPSAKRAFGALMYLAEARGCGVARAELQELLFPGRAQTGAAHSLRQLLYRLRGLGVPLEADAATVTIQASDVQADYAELQRTDPFDAHLLKLVTVGILPGYNPVYSRALVRWVDDRRSAIQHDVMQAFVPRLAMLRSTGQWAQLGPLARAILSVDPLNEEATLALAESLALAGQKTGAIRLLDAYMGEVGQYGGDVRLPASLVRRRISEHPGGRGNQRLGPDPFVGRSAEITELWTHFVQARQGDGRVVVLHGEPGIGKSRLAREFLKAASLDGGTTLTTECAPQDRRRPFGVLVDLVPKLLAAPGGLGVAPTALEYLNRLTQTHSTSHVGGDDIPPDQIFDLIIGAVRDLLDAVSDENPLVILIDDADSMDVSSQGAILEYTRKGGSLRVLFVLASRAKLLMENSSPATDQQIWFRVGSLSVMASHELYQGLVEQRATEGMHRAPDAVVTLSAGNPLYLRCLVFESTNASLVGIPPSLEALLTQRVRSLSETTLRAFVAAVLLGKHCSLDRLVRVAGLSDPELLSAIQHLEREGYLVANGAEIRSSHPDLARLATTELPPITTRMMRSAIAELLESEAKPGHDVSLLWDAADHWHQVGATTRAITLLESCADHCLSIGHPREACELLGRTLDICSPPDRPRLLLALIEAARIAEDFPLLLQSIELLRVSHQHPPLEPIHDELEMLAIQARRHTGTPLTELVPDLSRCVLSSDASPDHRLLAAPQLIAAYDLLFDGRSAVAAHVVIDAIPQPDDAARINHCRASLLFHCFAGKSASAIEASRRLLKLVAVLPSANQRARLIADAAIALFRCGECQEGLSAMQQAFGIACDLGMAPSALDTASMLAWMYYVLSDTTNWQRYEETSDQLHEAVANKKTRAAHYLSNKIEFAIERRDVESAHRWLTQAKVDYSEIDTPRSKLLAHSFALRIAQLRPSHGLSTDESFTLAAEHELGKQWGLHDNFTDAYWHELALADGPARANRMLVQYIDEFRRDGFPLPPPIKRIVREQGIVPRAPTNAPN